MSLPAYLFLYDENGMQLKGECLALGRDGAVEVMSSSYGISQPVDPHTGRMGVPDNTNLLSYTNSWINFHPCSQCMFATGDVCKKRSFATMRQTMQGLNVKFIGYPWRVLSSCQ